MKMFSKLLGNEETNAAAVLALSATVIALVAKGAGPVSSKKMVSRVLSNPVPGLNLQARVVQMCPSRRRPR
jgi:hypothetical protein